MKHLVILILIGLVAITSVNGVHGLWAPETPDELFKQSETVFVGNITSVNILEFERSNTYNVEENEVSRIIIENYTQTLDEYTVDIEEFLKNPQTSNTITMLEATVGGVPGRSVSIGGFELGDRALFYVPKIDGTNQYAPESFKIPEKCDAANVLEKPRIDGFNNFYMMQGGVEMNDNFTANISLQFSYDRDVGTLFGQSFDVSVGISKVTDSTIKNIFQKQIQVNVEPCEWVGSAKWDFVPTKGKYRMSMQVFEGTGGTGSSISFSVLDSIDEIMSPLKQFNSGISLDEIECKNNLVLIQKYDDSPACVTEQTKIKLIERGWTEKDTKDLSAPLLQRWTYDTRGEISSIDISEDDSTIVIGTKIQDTQKGMLYVLDNDGMLLWKKEFDSMIGHVDISNDAILVNGFHLCGGGGGAITYCNYAADVFDINGKKKQSYTHEDATAFSASLSPEGSSVITNTYDALKYFNLNENKSLTHVPDKYIEWATFLTGSKIIVKLDNTGEIFALDNTGNKIWNFTTIHQNSYSYAISNDGKYFVISDDTSPDDGNIYLLNSDGTLLWQDNIGDTVLHLAFSGDASHILVEINGAFMVYDIDGNLLWKNNIPSDLTMSSDGSFLVGTTFNQGSGASVTLFDGNGNILSNYPVSNESLSSIFALGNNDDYLVMANDTNKLVMFEMSPNFDDVAYDLTTFRNSDDLHVKVVPTDVGLFDVAIANGDSVEIPWDIRFDDGYTRSNFRVSIESDSDMESWITPTSPYTTINGVPPSEKIITIHVTPDAATGNHAVKILGRGDTVHNQTGWMTNLDGKTLGTVNVSVIPKQDSLSIKTGNVHSERGTFCVDWKSGGGTACTGLVTYQKMPITVFSNVSQTVTLDATTVQKGGWIKFVPEKLVATPNGTSSDMLIAGYLIPFKSNPSAEKSLIIEASSETESTTTVIPIRFGTISVINDEPSSIILGKIRANSNGTYYSISNAVYDPLKDDSADFVSVTLSVLGLWKDGNVSDLPDWLSVNIPKQSFALNATKPHHFMIVAQTDNAPVSGTYHIAINENINGKNFTELQELVIENRRY